MNPFVVAAIGVSVVFMALILIFLTLTIFDKFDVWLAERNKANEPALEPAVQAAPVAAAQPQPAVEEGISAEVVAAISAAIVATFGQTVRVKMIRYRRQSASSQWHLQGRVSHVSSRNLVKQPRRYR